MARKCDVFNNCETKPTDTIVPAKYPKGDSVQRLHLPHTRRCEHVEPRSNQFILQLFGSESYFGSATKISMPHNAIEPVAIKKCYSTNKTVFCIVNIYASTGLVCGKHQRGKRERFVENVLVGITFVCGRRSDGIEN